MIVDLILDRKDAERYDGCDTYKAHDFYFACLGYNRYFPHIADEITLAMDEGENEDVQEALCKYIDSNNYNPEIKDYINAKRWI